MPNLSSHFAHNLILAHASPNLEKLPHWVPPIVLDSFIRHGLLCESGPFGRLELVGMRKDVLGSAPIRDLSKGNGILHPGSQIASQTKGIKEVALHVDVDMVIIVKMDKFVGV